MKKVIDRPHASGYAALMIALYESIGIDCPHTLDGLKYFTNVMQPEGNDNFVYVISVDGGTSRDC